MSSPTQQEQASSLPIHIPEGTLLAIRREPPNGWRAAGILGAILVPVVTIPLIPVLVRLRAVGKELAHIRNAVERRGNMSQLDGQWKRVNAQPRVVATRFRRLSRGVQSLKAQTWSSRRDALFAKRVATDATERVDSIQKTVEGLNSDAQRLPKDEIGSALADIATFMDEVESKGGLLPIENPQRLERIRMLAKKLQTSRL